MVAILRKGLKLIPVVLVGVLLVFALIGCGGSKTPENHSTTPSTSPTTSTSTNVPGIGEPVMNGPGQITVHSCQYTQNVQDQAETAAPAGYQYAVVDLEVMNQGSVQISVGVADTYMKTPDGYKYEANRHPNLAYAVHPPAPEFTGYELISPGEIARGNVCYVVPVDKPLDFFFDVTPEGGRIKIKIR